MTNPNNKIHSNPNPNVILTMTVGNNWLREKRTELVQKVEIPKEQINETI